MKPGEEIIEQGIADLEAGLETIPSLLVSIGAPRLRTAGLEIPVNTIDDPEHRLYKLLASENQDSAHSRYNAHLRRLVSFERALECGI
ncbi:MAG: hypothetical protein HOP17_10680 [Acidobacteria bacterium]|nr:hypothetical protein [Acidobacteriota bacterium]